MSEEKELLLYSESFPLDEKKERKKIKPIAECHKYLKDIKIDPSQIVYKPLFPENVEEVKKLHKEWFPVNYKDDFFEYSIIKNNGTFFSEGAFYTIKTGENEYKEIILGLIICQWIYVDPFFFEMNGKDVAKEISKSLNYEDEAKFFLSGDKYYHGVYILSLGVIDECRKLGLGTRLLKDVFNYTIYFDLCIGVYLNVISDNFSGKKFYEKNGMSFVNHIKDYYLIEDKRYDSDVYLKVYTRKERDLVKEMISKEMTLKQKLIRNCILKPYYFIVKVFIFIFLFHCIRKRFKFEENQ